MSDAGQDGRAEAEGGAGAVTGVMFAAMTAERLRARCIWAGIVLVCSVLAPYEIVYDRGVFLWSLFAELDPAARLAALAPALAGVTLIAIGIPKGRSLPFTRPSTRAIAVLATFVTVNALLWIGHRSSAYGVVPLPDSITTRPAAFLAVFALTAAGVALRFHPRARQVARGLLVASVGAALAFYLWPSRGEIPARTLARALVSVATLGDVRLQIGYGMLLLLLLTPMAVALVGLVYLRAVPASDHPGVSIAAVWGMPALLLLLVYRAFLAGGFGPQALVTAFSALLIAAVLAPSSAAIEALVLGVTDPLARYEPGVRPAIAGGAAAGVVAAVLAAAFVVGRPAPKGVDWKLGPGSPEWDRTLGELVPSWEDARLARDAHARSEVGTGAQAQVATKARARAMIAAAKAAPTGKELATALETLAGEVDDLELSGRAFGRLVADANDAARRAELPYYLDPSVRVGTSSEGTTRRFHVTPFRVEETHGWKVGPRDEAFATLIVAPMTGEERPHLGFSRDSDPFALVLRPEIHRYAAGFAEGGDACGARADRDGAHEAELARCRAVAARIVERLGDGLERAVLAGTERHELQHQIDGPHLPLSGAVAELLAGFADESQDRANRELSAYVAEMTTLGVPPQMTLVHLFPFGVIAHGGAEHRVAVIVMSALSGKKLAYGAREVDTAKYADAFDEQVARSDDDLRAAARRAYRDLFGADLAEPVAERR